MRLTLGSKTASAHDDALWAVVWNQVNGSVLTGSVDETVKCWQQEGAEASNLEHQQTWTGHTLGVISLDVDARGGAACSSALDSFIRVRMIPTVPHARRCWATDLTCGSAGACALPTAWATWQVSRTAGMSLPALLRRSRPQVWNLEDDSTIAVVETAPSETWQVSQCRSLVQI